MKILKRALAVMMIAALAACNQPGGEPRDMGVSKQDIGTVLGGVGGAVAGAQFGKGNGQLVGVAAGTLLGAALGNSIGQSLDRADLAYYSRSQQTALETAQPGASLPWSNPESGNSGTVTAGNYYKTSAGNYCREFNQTVKIGGKNEQAFGKACRQPDGTWKIVE